MTIMRGHYIIDLIFGIIIAHYIFIIVNMFIHFLDNSSFTLKDEMSENCSSQSLKKSFEEKNYEQEPDYKASTSNSDDDVNKFY